MMDGISALYHLKATNPGKALEKACKEFETIFTHQLLKTMGETLEEGFMTESLAGEMYNDMLYWEVAREASEGRGLGLARILQDQMEVRMAKKG
jgi:flagellar protein FlgJ